MILLIISLLLIIVLHYGLKFIKKLQVAHIKKTQENQEYKNNLLTTIKNIDSKILPPDDPSDISKDLQELLRKNAVKNEINILLKDVEKGNS